MTDIEIITNLSNHLKLYFADFSDKPWHGDFEMSYILEENRAISLSFDGVELMLSCFNDMDRVINDINRLRSLRSLSISGLGIDDGYLKKITILEQLDTLEVSVDVVENLPIERLLHLRSLNISISVPSDPNDDRIDLSPLTTLYNLEELTIDTFCYGALLSPLDRLPKLRKLKIDLNFD